MSFKAFALTFLATLTIVSPAVFAAEDTTSQPSGVLSTESKTQSPWEFTYFGTYSGPALNHLDGGGAIDSTTLDYTDGEQNLANQFKLNYKINEDIFVGPVVTFKINPFLNGSTLKMEDSGVRIGNSHVIKTDTTELLVDFRVMAPLKPANRAVGEVLNLQSLQLLSYKVPKSKITLGVIGFHYFQFYGSGAPTRDPKNGDDPRDLNMYIAPTLTYQFTPTFAGTLFVEFYPYHRMNDSWTNIYNDPSDIAPGISWDISDNVNFSPQLLFYPSRLNGSTIGSIAYLSAKFL